METASLGLGTLFVVFDAHTRPLVEKLEQAEKKLAGLATSFGQHGRNMFITGMRVSLGLSLPAKILGTTAVREYMRFDDAMIKSQAIMGDISATMDRDMRKLAETMSVQWNMAAQDVAKAYYYLASAGLDVEQSMAGLADTVKFAKAGNFDLATAVELSTDALSALGLKVKDPIKMQTNLIRVMDVLTKANTLADATTRQFSEALTNQAAAIGRIAGQDIESIVAVLASLAEQGVKGENAGMRYAMAMDAMSRAFQMNRKEWDKYEVSLYKSDGSLRQMSDLLHDLEGLMRNASTEQREMILTQLGFNLRTKRTIKMLIGMSGSIRMFESQLRQAGGTVETVSNKQMQSLSEKLGKVWQRTKKAARSIVEEFVPSLERAGEAVEKIAERFENMSAGTKKMLGGMTAFAIVLGPAITVLGVFLLLGERLIIIFGSLMSLFKKAFTSIGIKAFIGGMYTLTGLAAGLFVLWNSVSWALEQFGITWSKVFGIAESGASSLTDKIKNIPKWIEWMSMTFKYRLDQMQKITSNLMYNAFFTSAFWEKLPIHIGSAIKTAYTVFTGGFSAMFKAVGASFGIFVRYLRQKMGQVSTIMKNMWRTVKGQELIPDYDWMYMSASEMWKGMVDAGTDAWNKSAQITNDKLNAIVTETDRKLAEAGGDKPLVKWNDGLDELAVKYDNMLEEWAIKWNGFKNETWKKNPMKAVTDDAAKAVGALDAVADAMWRLLSTGLSFSEYWGKAQERAFETTSKAIPEEKWDPYPKLGKLALGDPPDAGVKDIKKIPFTLKTPDWLDPSWETGLSPKDMGKASIATDRITGILESAAWSFENTGKKAVEAFTNMSSFLGLIDPKFLIAPNVIAKDPERLDGLMGLNFDAPRSSVAESDSLINAPTSTEISRPLEGTETNTSKLVAQGILQLGVFRQIARLLPAAIFQ